MSSYRYLGYGITNENGVAQLKYDENGDELEHSYTGVGAGEVDVLASLDNPVSSGSIVSGTLSVIDGAFYDIGYGNDAKDEYWYLSRENVSINPDNDCTTITENNSGSFSIVVPNLTTSPTGAGSYVFDSPLAIEFDLISYTSGCGMRLYDRTNVYSNNFPQIVTNDSHVKVEVTGSKIIIHCNGESRETNYSPNAKLQCGFKLNGGCTLKFKNFVIYPI